MKSNFYNRATENSTTTQTYRHNPYSCEQTLVYSVQSLMKQRHVTSRALAAPHMNVPLPRSHGGSYGAETAVPSAVPPPYQPMENWTQHFAEDSIAASNFSSADAYYVQPPEGTLHTQLFGQLNFVPYPTEAFDVVEPTLPKNQLVRMFIGQLPYNVTEMQLAWILYTFGGQVNMYHFERITKTDYRRGGVKIPTGCLHFHVEPQDVEPLLNFINHRLLVDDTGIWVAESLEERDTLARYCDLMKVDKSRRFQGRPYRCVHADPATSTFDPDAVPLIPPVQRV